MTNNSINSNIPIEIAKGGTNNTSFSTNMPVAFVGGQIASITGTASQVLTSQGIGLPPHFTALPTNAATFFVSLSADPSNPDPGDNWYNTTTHLFKGCRSTGVGNVWVVKANMNLAKFNSAGCGSAASAFSLTGSSNISSAGQQTEQYDGVLDSWFVTANRITATYVMAAAGTTSDGLCFGGLLSDNFTSTNDTERYARATDTWTTKATMVVALRLLAGAGSAADALYFGGYTTPPGPGVGSTGRYDGVGDSWTAKAALNTPRVYLAGSGTAADALSFGGNSGSVTNIFSAVTENYDGGADTWTTKTPMNSVDTTLAGCGNAGGSTSLAYGGNTGSGATGLTQLYDGGSNTWTNQSSLNISRAQTSGCGISSDALAFGGSTPTLTSSTERFEGSTPTIVTFTTAP